mmetsp:Transcript_24469/g.68599  ORF Transcript_24469/g.68599 Transcript_24469/m.68599 type:complete len:297 (-) Transcript_24469:70-960(-)
MWASVSMFSLAKITSVRAPPSTNSIDTQISPSTMYASRKFTMLSWWLSFMMRTSLRSTSFLACLAMTICLIATFIPVFLHLANCTVPDTPLPISWKSLYSFRGSSGLMRSFRVTSLSRVCLSGWSAPPLTAAPPALGLGGAPLAVGGGREGAGGGSSSSESYSLSSDNSLSESTSLLICFCWKSSTFRTNSGCCAFSSSERLEHDNMIAHSGGSPSNSPVSLLYPMCVSCRKFRGSDIGMFFFLLLKPFPPPPPAKLGMLILNFDLPCPWLRGVPPLLPPWSTVNESSLIVTNSFT